MMSHTAKKQAGISLMLAVLILSAITAIAFSLATIVFIEIRSSGDVVRTEPNLYASLGVTEEALFQYKRFVSASDLDIVNCNPKALNPCVINNVTLSLPNVNGQPQPIQYEDNPIVKVIDGGSQIEIPMYQPDNYAKQYGKIKIDILPGARNSLKVKFRNTDSSGVVTYEPPSGNYTVSSGTPFVYTGFTNSGQYDLILDNTSPGSSDLSAVLSTYDTNQTTAKGLPFIGQNVLKIVADYLGLSRTYRVQIPLVGANNSSLSNVAASSAGAIAVGYFNNGTAGNEYSISYPATSTNNADRKGQGWGSGSGGWNSEVSNPLPDWLQVNFAGSKTINEIDVYTLANAFPLSTDPDGTTSASIYGVNTFQIQYDSDPSAGTTWTTVPGGSISGNTLAWRKVNFTDVSTDKIRIYITAVNGGYSRLVEVEAYGY